MKTIIFFLVIYLQSTKCLIGQQLSSSHNEPIHTGLLLGFEFCHRSFSTTDQNAIIFPEPDRVQPLMPVYKVGILIRKRISRYTVLESGICYSIKGYQTRKVALEWESSDPNFPVTSRSRFIFKYLSIPITAGWLFGEGKLQFLLSGGISGNIFLERQTKIILRFGDGSRKTTSSSSEAGYLKFCMGGIASFGIQLKMKNRLLVILAPSYRMSLQSIRGDDGVNERFNSFGLNLSLLPMGYRKTKRNDPISEQL